jgi:tetratricopeptide (TPR) repeat protein
MEDLDESPERMVRAALALDRQGRVADAIAAYHAVLRRWPMLSDCWYCLAVLQRKARLFQPALDSYQRALELAVKRPEEVRLNRAVIYADDLRDDLAAERELRSALVLNSTYIPALLNLANLHEDQGERDAALAVYQQVLALDPESPRALARYANMRAFASSEDPSIAQLRRAIASSSVAIEERANLGFALGRALDGCADYDSAFEAYVAANRDSRLSAEPGTGSYDAASEERFVDRLMSAFPAPAHPTAIDLPAGPRPVFILGMFRSGSTLLEQLLAGHPRITAGGEIDVLPYFARTAFAPFPEAAATASAPKRSALAAQYVQTLARLFPAADWVTDKRPDNYLYIGLIKSLFPDSKIIHTTRDPLDNCLSIYFLHLHQGMSYALNLMDIGHHYLQYRRLMKHWIALYPGDIIDVNYDMLVRQPRNTVEALLTSLALDWDDRCDSVLPTGTSIKTASVWQAREPLYQRSSGRARHYLRHLEQLRAFLAAAG